MEMADERKSARRVMGSCTERLLFGKGRSGEGWQARRTGWHEASHPMQEGVLRDGFGRGLWATRSWAGHLRFCGLFVTAVLHGALWWWTARVQVRRAHFNTHGR